jgi:hypothetical protein
MRLIRNKLGLVAVKEDSDQQLIEDLLQVGPSFAGRCGK